MKTSKDPGNPASGPPASGPSASGAPSLAELQDWFGRAISRPIPLAFQVNPLERSAPDLKEMGDVLVRGRGGLSGFDRIGLYNKQYWFRLITIMQGEYGCSLHILGLKAYNQWAIRFLEAHPPSSPYLSRLDEAWPGFMAERYPGPDREAVIQAIAFDRAFSKAFDALDGPPLSAAPVSGASPAASGDAPDWGALPLQLAPHATVLRLDWDFTVYRALCLADESLEQVFELKPGASCRVVWRGRDLEVRQKRVSAAACKVLEELKEPTTVPEVFDRLEGRLDYGEQADLEAHLAAWFREWVQSGLLTRAPEGSGAQRIIGDA